MLYAWSKMLKERDDILKALNKELENVDVLRFDRPKIDALINNLEEKDRILMSSRYMRVVSDASYLDRAIVGVQSFFGLRSRALILESLAPILGMVATTFAVFAGSHDLYQTVVRLLKRIIGTVSFLTPAYAAAGDAINPESMKLTLLAGFAVVVALVFIWFAGVASLSKTSTTRKAAMDFVKSGMSFFAGVVTGLFAKPF
jgi:hypothetical protein